MKIPNALKPYKDWVYYNLYSPIRKVVLLKQIFVRERLFSPSYDNFGFHAIPIIICNFNRLECLKTLIRRLEELDYHNIHIIDNNSQYPPLLEYYDSCPYTVYRLKKNLGHLSLWKSGIYRKFRNRYFVYTDSDVVPGPECPEDFIRTFYDIMQRFHAVKVGNALKIDDLPDCFKDKAKVIKWEKQFWKDTLETDVYNAQVDTTFALYRPNVKWGTDTFGLRIRVGGIYTALHLPWYADSSSPTEEDLYYMKTCNNSATWITGVTFMGTSYDENINRLSEK